MGFKDWQQWGKRPDESERHNIHRLSGELPDMECTNQLVKIISEIHKPGMKILDVGCNVGHYLKGIRKQFPNLDYVGVDAYEHYIDIAKNNFENDTHASFTVKDIFKPIFPNQPYDIVYCCNVIQHLPDFRIPITNLLQSTKKCCIVRTFLADYTHIVKSTMSDTFDDEGNPLDFWYLNTWNKKYFSKFINQLGWNVEFIKDEFNPKQIQKEFETIKNTDSDVSTRIENGMQIVEDMLENWLWAKITPK